MENSKQSKKPVPKSLFRYYSWNRAIDFLISQNLYFSSVSLYNDPFEFFPATEYTDELNKYSYDKLKKYIGEKIHDLEVLNSEKNYLPHKKKSFYEKVLENSDLLTVGAGAVLANTARTTAFNMGAATLAGTSLIPFGPLLTAAALLGAATVLSKKAKDNKEDNETGRITNTQRSLNDTKHNDLTRFNSFIELYFNSLNNIKTCCFSAEYDNILLWSHYAEQHKGLSIAFKTDSPCWKGLQFKKINYVDKRIQISLTDDNSSEFITNLITSKAKYWKYEKEWRLINYNSQRTNRIKIDPTAIDCIFLGLRTSDDQSDTIKRIRDKFYKETKIKRAYMDNDAFKLQFEDI